MTTTAAATATATLQKSAPSLGTNPSRGGKGQASAEGTNPRSSSASLTATSTSPTMPPSRTPSSSSRRYSATSSDEDEDELNATMVNNVVPNTTLSTPSGANNANNAKSGASARSGRAAYVPLATAMANAMSSLANSVANTDDDDNSSEGFTPVNSQRNLRKREARQRKEAFWRLTFPELYAAGLNHADVGQRVAALRAAQPPPLPHHGAQLLADGRRGPPPGYPSRPGHADKRKRPNFTPTGQTPHAKYGRPATSTTPHGQQNQGQNQNLDQNQDQAQNQNQNQSYAAATSRNTRRPRVEKEREFFPLMLFVHAGKDSRLPLSQEEAEDVRKALSQLACDNLGTDRPTQLKVAFTKWSVRASCLLVACLTEVTKSWYTLKIDTLNLAGLVFRAWEVPPPITHRRAKITVNGLNHSAEWILRLIKGYNQEIEGEILLQEQEIQKGPDGHLYVALAIDDVAAACLATKHDKWTVDLATDRRRVSYAGKRELVQRMMEQYPGSELTKRLMNHPPQPPPEEDPDEEHLPESPLPPSPPHPVMETN